MQWTVYVIMNSNRMAQALRHPGAKAEAARLACQTFRSLLIDPEFRKSVEEMYLAAVLNQREMTERVISSRNVLEGFLEQERQLMLEADMDEEIADDVVRSVLQNLEQVSIGNLDPLALFERLRGVKVATCRLARRLAADAEEERWLSKTKKLTVGLGGAALIGLNVSALAASLGIGTVGAALSGAIGATAIQLGTDWLKDYI